MARALTGESRCYVFQTFEWASLWYQTICKVEQVKPFIVCVTGGDGHSVIMFPLGVRRRYRCRILLSLGGDFTDLCGARFAQLYADDRIDAEAHARHKDNAYAAMPLPVAFAA